MAAATKLAKIKWGSVKLEIEYNEGITLDEFRQLVFSETKVTAESQSLFLKGKALTEDNFAAIKNKARMKLVGSAQKLVVQAELNIQFEEDMTQEERAQLSHAFPPGLENLGNTCYLNATVQCLKSIPEFNDQLVEFGQNSLNPSVAKAFGQLMYKMNSTEDSFAPMNFVSLFRQACPAFATLTENRQNYQQQDADEFLMTLLNQIKGSVENLNSNLFEGEFEVTEKCVETEDETTSIKTFDKLTCFIDKDISHLVFGLQKGLTTQIEKRNPTLGRNAVYETTSRIIKLPKYLIVQKARFSWKSIQGHDQGGVACKILKKITFPLKLDVDMLCTTDLKTRIQDYRKRLLEFQDEQRELRQNEGLDIEAIRAEMAEKGKPKTAATEEAPEAMDVVAEDEPTPTNITTPAVVATEAVTEAQAAVPAPMTEENQDTMAMEVDDNAENIVDETGQYHLIGVVTHKGRSAKAGHYIGYAKDSKSGKWMKFDDDIVTEIKKEEIATLYGGGDFQMGYLCFYQKIDAEPTSL